MPVTALARGCAELVEFLDDFGLNSKTHRPTMTAEIRTHSTFDVHAFEDCRALELRWYQLYFQFGSTRCEYFSLHEYAFLFLKGVTTY